jgi:hypothetical protein
MGWHAGEVRALGLAEFAAGFEGWEMANCQAPAGLDEIDTGPEAVAALDAMVEEEKVKAWLRKSRG